ncbi:BnaA09g29370D [Brassica napus]|uniref:BnaA09g29370D protein n=1 Tax=Brassica napus TaxID=3708 RepID=A0A078FUX3_BRANA|nr:BnaA09g29370D [Brassica napus]
MSSNGKSALSGDSSSEKPKGVQAESYSGPINPSTHPVSLPATQSASPTRSKPRTPVKRYSDVDYVFAVRCLINGKLKNGGVRILRRSWSYTMCRNLISRVSRFQPLLLDPKMRTQTQSRYHLGPKPRHHRLICLQEVKMEIIQWRSR